MVIVVEMALAENIFVPKNFDDHWLQRESMLLYNVKSDRRLGAKGSYLTLVRVADRYHKEMLTPTPTTPSFHCNSPPPF